MSCFQVYHIFPGTSFFKDIYYNCKQWQLCPMDTLLGSDKAKNKIFSVQNKLFLVHVHPLGMISDILMGTMCWPILLDTMWWLKYTDTLCKTSFYGVTQLNFAWKYIYYYIWLNLESIILVTLLMMFKSSYHWFLNVSNINMKSVVVVTIL